MFLTFRAKRWVAVVTVVAVAAALLGCEQYIARNLGGNLDFRLPCGQKLVTATWKVDDLWYMTRPIRAGEEPETVTFSVSTLLGMMEGKVTFYESSCLPGGVPR